jgi:hypothetical protein
MVASINIGRHRFLIPAYLFVFLAATVFILRCKSFAANTVRFTTMLALTMTTLPILGIGYQWLSSQSRWDQGSNPVFGDNFNTGSQTEERPDIYYIILDGYAREDYLRSTLNYDNEEFIESLEKLGFFVADKSTSNYNWTALSLGSSLNMDFVQALGLDLVYGNYPAVFVDPIRHNRVRTILENIGYSTVAFRTNYLPTEMIDADYYITTDPDEIEALQPPFSLNSFETLLLRSSAGLIIWDLAGPEARNWVNLRVSYPRLVLRETIQYQLDELNEIPYLPGPKFVFVHIVAPHSPYLFGRDGQYVNADGSFSLSDSDELIQGRKDELYTNQLHYINIRIVQAIESILARSENKPIIILQSDHGPCINVMSCVEGPGLKLKFAILNAYLVPVECEGDLYSEITPVNSFRTVLNCLYGSELPILEDRSFYTNHPRYSSYEFIDVTDELD